MAVPGVLRRRLAAGAAAVGVAVACAGPAAAQNPGPAPTPQPSAPAGGDLLEDAAGQPAGAFPDAADSDNQPGQVSSGGGGAGGSADSWGGWAGSGGPDEYDQSGLAAWRTQCGGPPPGGGSSSSGPQATRSRITSGAATGTRLDCGHRRSDASALDAATGDQAAGRKNIPASHYDIGWSSSSGIGLAVNVVTGGAAEEISRRLWGNGTQLVFGFDKLLVRASMGVVRWAFNFEIAGKLSSFVQDVASGYYGSLTGGSSSSPLNVYTLALFATLAGAAWLGVRGQGARALGEVGLTWLVGVVFVAFVVTQPNGFGRIVEETLQAAGKLSGAIAATTGAQAAPTAQCPDPSSAGSGVPAGTTAACPFTQSLHAAFIATPYDLINWGQPLGEPDDASNDLAACAAARDQILKAGPHGTSDKPRFVMGSAGPQCQALADFNHDPSVSRFGLSVMILIVAALVLVLVLLSAVTLVGAQLLMVGLGAVLPFAAVAGLLPGSARRLAFKWLGGVAKVVLVVVALSLALSLYLVGMGYLQDAFADQPWIVQGGLLIAATVGMFWVRRQAVGAGKQAGTGVGRRLATSTPGRSRGGLVGAAERGWRRGDQQQNQIRNLRRARGRARAAKASTRQGWASAKNRAGSVKDTAGTVGSRLAQLSHARSTDQIALAEDNGHSPTAGEDSPPGDPADSGAAEANADRGSDVADTARPAISPPEELEPLSVGAWQSSAASSADQPPHAATRPPTGDDQERPANTTGGPARTTPGVAAGDQSPTPPRRPGTASQPPSGTGALPAEPAEAPGSTRPPLSAGGQSSTAVGGDGQPPASEDSRPASGGTTPASGSDDGQRPEPARGDRDGDDE